MNIIDANNNVETITPPSGIEQLIDNEEALKLESGVFPCTVIGQKKMEQWCFWFLMVGVQRHQVLH